MADKTRVLPDGTLESLADIGGGAYAPKVSLATGVAGEDLTNNLLSTRKPTGWSVVHTPAENTKATASKAAGSDGVKHVCTGFTVSLCSDATAPAAINLTVALRDGATGAGTILWQSVIALPAVAGAFVTIWRESLWIEGTAETALTLEYSAAGGAHTYESVTLCGVEIV